MLTFETSKQKIVHSKRYNYVFNRQTGFFARWGKKKKDDPKFSPFGAEIADIEVTTSCSGLTYDGKDHLCKFCYKSNTPNGKNMSFETFRKMLDNFPSYKQNKVIGKGEDGKNYVHFKQEKWNLKGRKKKVGVSKVRV